MKTNREPKPTMNNNVDDDDDDYDDLENGFIIDYDAMSQQPSGKETAVEPPRRRGGDSKPSSRQHPQRQPEQTSPLKSDTGNHRPQQGRHRVVSGDFDDDENLPVYVNGNRGGSEPSADDATPSGDDDQLTFYSKPMFDNPTDFEVWKARTDNGGGMPYRHGADDPWLSSLRRPVNYAEINKYNAEQQRAMRKLQERVQWKSYTELHNENGPSVGQGTNSTSCRRCRRDYGDCNCEAGRVPSDMSRPQGPSPNKMAACSNCCDGRLCSRAKAGLPGCFGSSPQSFNPPATFLPPLSGTTTSQSVPLTFSTTPGGDVQKVTVDINLKLVTPREVMNNVSNMTARATGRDHHHHHHHHHQQQQQQVNVYGPQQSSRKTTRCATCVGGLPAATGCKCPSDTQRFQKSALPSQLLLVSDLSNPAAGGLDWLSSQRGSVPALSLAGLNNTKLNVIHPPPLKSHRHTKFGRYGEYRVFCADDYNKMKREMRLASVFGSEKDPETLQEKKEKLEVRKSYGRLVNDKNQLDLTLLKSKRIQAAMIAADEELANTARKFH